MSIPPSHPIRVMLVDDHPVVREGVAAVLNLDNDCEVVGSAGSVKDALASMDRTQPDVITIDVRLPDMDGIDACELIRMQHPQVRILVLTRFLQDGELAVLAKTTMRELALDRPLGDA